MPAFLLGPRCPACEQLIVTLPAHRPYCLASAKRDDLPIMLNYGWGERAFTVEAALGYFERMADEVLG